MTNARRATLYTKNEPTSYNGIIGLRVWVDPQTPAYFQNVSYVVLNMGYNGVASGWIPNASQGVWLVEVFFPTTIDGVAALDLDSAQASSYLEVQVLRTGSGTTCC